jgi:hypothetical protein
MAQNDYEGDDYKFPDEVDEPKAEEKESEEEDFSFEVEDDTPEQDRGRKTAEPPEEVTEEELASYDEKVQKRIKKFTRGYHDERRAKEAALRERQAAEEYAKQLFEENRKLQERLASGSQEYISQAKQVAESELAAAKRAYREAYDDGDTDAIVAAQEQIARATLKFDKVAELKPLQVEEKELQIRQQPQTVDRRAENWRSQNGWFGQNRRMTAFALGLHSELVEDRGIDPSSDRYYQEIDKTMRRTFPDYFGSDEDRDAPQNQASEPAQEDEPPRRASKPATVVAPATRSTSPNKVRLTASQIAIAKRIGVPLELYAKQVANLRNGA